MTEEQKQPQPRSSKEGELPTQEDVGGTAATPETTETAPQEGQPQPAKGETPKPQPSPWKRRFRRFLWFLALVVVVFLCGFLTSVAILVQPRDQKISRLNRQVQTLTTQVDDLESRLQEKEAEIRSLEKQLRKNETQLADLKDEHLRLVQELALVRAQRSVYKAIAALEIKDTRGARLALEAAREDLAFLYDHANERLKPLVADLQKALEDLQPQLTPTDKTIVQLQRLAENLEDLQDLLEK